MADKKLPNYFKECIVCGEMKHISEYGSTKKNISGYTGKCRACLNKYVLEYKKKNRDRVNAIERKYDKKHSGKLMARARLRYAVKKGEIIKPDHCEKVNLNISECTGQLQAHHYLGYEGIHWGDVKWLCVKHHGLEHRKYTPIDYLKSKEIKEL